MERTAERDGGYDEGYEQCPCFWGRNPGSLVAAFVERVGSIRDARVLDVGCGEGKNAHFLASLGAQVTAVDVSALAISKARALWPNADAVDWRVGDVANMSFAGESFDLVVAYGLFHCLEPEAEVRASVRCLQRACRVGGHHVVCSFNDRSQDLSAHPGFSPTLIPHAEYLSLYSNWDVLEATDLDLHETHPHNGIPHSHSLTRMVARRRS